MKILVVGASQGTGALCVRSALARGHSVSAFSRNPAKLDITHAALTKIAGDFHDAASVRGAVAGHDAVIVCAAPKVRAHRGIDRRAIVDLSRRSRRLHGGSVRVDDVGGQSRSARRVTHAHTQRARGLRSIAAGSLVKREDKQ